MNNDMIDLGKLTKEELNIIVTGLGKLPAEVSFDLIVKIKNAVNDQIVPKQVENTNPQQ